MMSLSMTNQFIAQVPFIIELYVILELIHPIQFADVRHQRFC